MSSLLTREQHKQNLAIISAWRDVECDGSLDASFRELLGTLLKRASNGVELSSEYVQNIASAEQALADEDFAEDAELRVLYDYRARALRALASKLH